ncbi:Helix-turn-helix domain-containing protein [Paenibacillus algorifonticola]|uniref:Helix-turn-helix domain-containing protein n=1 Tax=Paenibacillus algorifonticola TaxID=684063 RepID=A0A1I2F850_9BACL|nr:response regulator [Paenibacillus algorifonticola]SFF01614.1 Helix-turn-helix domain-containing protein [Paenibacillus algorifonticola]
MLKTLIVEDEPRMREGLKRIIYWEKYGFNLCGDAENGRQALELIEREQPALVITDIRLPGITGLELMKDVTGRMDTCFIVISGYDEFEYVKTALICGAVDYILKPVEEEQLIGALLRVKKRLLKALPSTAASAGSAAELEMGMPSDDPIAFVKEYVASHYQEQVTMKEIAGKTYLHPFYLGQLFRKATGIYFNDYVHQIRVDKARLLLATTSSKIADIAAGVGYPDPDYFVQQFKKITGCTPSHFRKNQL